MPILYLKVLLRQDKYYVQFMWKGRYAECISMAETVERMKG